MAKSVFPLHRRHRRLSQAPLRLIGLVSCLISMSLLHGMSGPLLLNTFFATPTPPKLQLATRGSPFSRASSLYAIPNAGVLQMAARLDESSDSNLDQALLFIKRVLKEAVVLLFMKGVPKFPQCGFSARVVRILDETGVPYKAVNVLDEIVNPGLRVAVKEFSNWPTFPQLYINGTFIGGADIVSELHENGQLLDILHSLQSSKLGSDRRHNAQGNTMATGNVRLVVDPEKPVASALSKALSTAFSLQRLIITDQTSAHKGHHHGVTDSERNFHIEIAAAEFNGLSPLERQRMVYDALHEVMPQIHALSLVTKYLEES